MLRYLPLLISLMFLAVACGDDDVDAPNGASPSPSEASAEYQWSDQYMTLGEARQFISGLGLDGVSLSARAYECIQFTCPDEAPGDDSWGCLSLLPTGDPDNVESLRPDDPPGWYSVVWRGSLGETYAARPEPVVSEPTVTLEHHEDLVCGHGGALKTTAADAERFLSDAGLESLWQSQVQPVPTCPASVTCPIPGVPADTMGCVGISVFDLPERTPGQSDPTVTVYINWSSSGGEAHPDGVNFTYSVIRPLTKVEAAVAAAGEDDCFESPAPPPDPYDWVPYTQVIQPTYWRLTEAPAGTKLELLIAVGGSCDAFERVDVVESDTSVTINAYIRHSSPGPYSGCNDMLNHHMATVELDEPLGDRELLGCAPAEIWYIDHEIDCAEPGHN